MTKTNALTEKRTWLPPEKWEALKAGIGCPMCEDIHLPENPHSFLVAEREHTFIRLPRNQFLRGWTIVVLKRHACELFDLSPIELAAFWHDVTDTARALDALYRPVKINYCVFGHLCPHLHCHLLVHSYADDPHKLIDMNEQTALLSEAEYQKMINDLRDHLKIIAEPKEAAK